MDRGGTITWYLTANDADFLASMKRARAEAKLTGAEVDNSLNRGTSGATTALRNLGNENNNTTGSVRNLRKESVGLAQDTNTLRATFDGLTNSNGGLSTSLGSVAVKSSGLSSSLSDTTNRTRLFQTALGGTALKSFAADLDRSSNSTKTIQKPLKDTSLSLKDFYSNLSQSASQFRSFQIAIRGFQLTSLILSATLAGGALIELAGALAQLSGLFLVAPAAVATYAGILGTLKVATSGVADAFKAYTKQSAGVSAASSLQKKQTDLVNSANKQDASLVKQLTKLNADYADTVQELAKERLAELNAVILKGVTAWQNIAQAAGDYLDISKSLVALTDDVATAQQALNDAITTYGPASTQAAAATRDLYAAQGKLAQANADLDEQYGSIKDNVKDLATNVNSLAQADRNQLAASLLNLKALKQDKIARGESTSEITDMISALDGLIHIKDTDLTVNPDFGAAQTAINSLKAQFPQISIAAATTASDTENSLTKSLQNISDQMADIAQQRVDLQNDLADGLKEAADASSAGIKDPFEGLSKNAKAFVLALADVKDMFQGVKNTVQDNFFAGLDKTIINTATVIFPVLETGLGAIATAMNGVIKKAAEVVQQPFFTKALGDSLTNTASAVTILQGGVEPLLRVFTDLVNVANPYITMLSSFIVKQLDLAAAFTGSADGQSKINGAIQDGIKAFKAIGKLVLSVVDLLGDLFKIADESGGGIINTLTTIVDNIDKFVTANPEKFTALFQASGTVLLALADTIGKILIVILDVIEAYNNLDGPAKNFVTNLIVISAIVAPIVTYLSAMVASLKLVGGVGVEAFQLLQGGVLGAQKILVGYQLAQQGLDAAQIASSDVGVGAWGRVGSAISAVKDGVGTAASAIGNAFSNAGSKAGEIGSKIGSAVGSVATSAASMVASGAKVAAGWVASAAQSAGAWIAQTAVMVAKGVATAAIMVVQAGISAAAWVAGAVATAAAWVIANAAILGIFGLIALAVVGAIVLITSNWDKIVGFFQGIFQGIQDAIGVVVKWVQDNWPLLLAILTGPIGLLVLFVTQNFGTIQQIFANAVQFIKDVWGGIVGFFAGIWNGIVAIFQVAVQFYGDLFTRAFNAIKTAFGAVGNFFKGIWDSIVNAFSGAVDLGRNIITGLVNGISAGKDFVINKIKDIAKGALDAIKNFFGIHSPSRVMAQMGSYVMEGFGNGIESMGDTVVNAAQTVAEGVVGAFGDMNTQVSGIGTDFAVTGSSTLTSQLAPSVSDPNSSDGGVNSQGGVNIYQTNQVYSELDMDQVNRNLTWELNKV